MTEAVSFKNPELISFWQHFNTRSGFNQPAFIELYKNTDDETAVCILARFNENLKEGAVEMDDALKKGDGLRVSKAAHKIAGTCELLGFKNYGLHAKNLSHQLKTEGTFPVLSQEISGFLNETIDLFTEIQKVCPTLKNYL